MRRQYVGKSTNDKRPVTESAKVSSRRNRRSLQVFHLEDARYNDVKLASKIVNKLRLPKRAEKIKTSHVEMIAPRVIEAAIASV